MKIGVLADCFKLPLEDSLRTAAEMGFDGVQIYATNGQFSPDMCDEERQRFRRLINETGLSISALCGDMGGHGFEIEADNPARIEKTKRIIDLAAAFDVSVVTTHIGVIPSDRSHPRYAVMLDALTECGLYAASQGVTMAIETGPETADTLHRFLHDTQGGVGVNLDPANFVMVTGQDPVEAVEILGPHIVHTHAKDGVMLQKTDPTVIYNHFADGGIEALNVADYFLETPLGEGHVPFPRYIEALLRVGFDGYLTIERETGTDPRADIALAQAMLQTLV